MSANLHRGRVGKGCEDGMDFLAERGEDRSTMLKGADGEKQKETAIDKSPRIV